MKIIKNWWKQLKSKKLLLAGVMVTVLVIAGTGVWMQKKSSNDTTEIQYEQARVTRDNIIVGFDSDGNINYSKVNLRFGVKGTISEILVTEGDEVQKGAVIAKLYDRDYQDQYQLALAKLSDSQEQEITNLLDSELRLMNLEAELERQRDLYDEMETIPEAYSANELKLKKLELAGKETEYEHLKRKYEIQKNKSISQDELSVKMALENLEETILYAPVSGTLLSLANKAGERVSDEQDFAVLHENDAVKASTRVIEYDVGQIKVGQKVYVTVEALPDQRFTGQVSKVNSLPVSDSTGLVNYEVEIDILDPSGELKDGMNCSVSFVIKEVTNCLIVPYRAIKIVEGKQVVNVIDENGNTIEKQIKAGFTDGTNVEILEGLNVNETVIYTRSR
ncbi:efflux RND transporter periplasmic adaptor subunit [Desulforamulus aquiferis]|uniref:Efflux RND transporter periplasmic adaptor subunit n=1 Tax=Desulforamulus aquiferis TaxID=1397668 RepID=A0AAW7ZCZ5_9FIRM|nr:efflux RND transporter periplasmic adaptor subunit [Desulforamulus aquiferis]MDO7786660.1 efflux RND transporter periplasmic adaptor subunit [Desulforamulus aquiferis]